MNINSLTLCQNFNARDLFDDLLGWESSDLPHALVQDLRITVQESIRSKARRYFKVHEAFCDPVSRKCLFSPSATEAAFYIIRNPLDVSISFANHLGTDIDRAIDLMVKEDASLKMPVQLQQPLGSWAWHVNSWSSTKTIKCHIIKYEDMLTNALETFSAACRFANIDATPAEIQRAISRCSFEVLREQEQQIGFIERPPKCGSFFNSGRSGNWREHLSPKQVKKIVDCNRQMMQQFGYLDADVIAACS